MHRKKEPPKPTRERVAVTPHETHMPKYEYQKTDSRSFTVGYRVPSEVKADRKRARSEATCSLSVR